MTITVETVEHTWGWKMRLIDVDAFFNDFPELKNYEHASQEYEVDAEPVKHGHWIEVQRIHEKDHTAICECSLCGDTVWVYDGQRAWNYCPSCGAQMEVKDGN